MFRTGTNADGSSRPLVELIPPRKLDRPDGLRHIGRGRFLLAEAGDQGGITLMTVKGDTVTLSPLPGGRTGTTSAVALGKTSWAVAGKLRYRTAPEIGRTSCRGSICQYVLNSVVPVSITNKT